MKEILFKFERCEERCLSSSMIALSQEPIPISDCFAAFSMQSYLISLGIVYLMRYKTNLVITVFNQNWENLRIGYYTQCFVFGQILQLGKLFLKIVKTWCFWCYFLPFFKLKTCARFLQQVLAGSQNILGFLKGFYFHIWSIAKFG